MAKEYDGEIQLSVSLKPGDIKSSAQSLARSVKSIFEVNAGQALDKSLQRIAISMDKVNNRAENVQAKMRELEGTKVATKEFASLEKDLDIISTKMDHVRNSMKAFEDVGNTTSPKYAELRAEMEKLEKVEDGLLQKSFALEDSGKAYMQGIDTEKYAKLSNELSQLNNQQRINLASYQEAEAKLKDEGDSADKTATQVRKVSNETKKATKNTDNYSKSLNKTTKSMGNFGSSVGKLLKKLLLLGLGISTIYTLLNKMRSAIVDGLNEMALMNEGNNQMNRSLSMITSSFDAFKNSIAAAVAPLVNLLAPALSRVLDIMTNVTNQVASFIALLTGASTYMKALKVQKDYAASLDKTAKKTKKAEQAAKGYLSPLDEINKYQSKEEKEEDKEDEGKGPALFAEVPVDTKLLDWLNKLKNMLQPIIDKIKELKDKFLEGLKYGMGDNWDERVERLKKGAAQIRDALVDIFTDPRVVKAMDEWSNSLAFMLGSLVGSMASIGLTIATNLVAGLGDYLTKNKERIKNYLIDMFNIGTEVNYLLATLFADIADIFSVFAEENGIQLTSNLIGIFADAFMGIAELAAKFGRDILQLIVQPLDDNKEKIKQTLNDILGFLASITGSIKDLIDETVDKFNAMYDEHIKPLFDSLANGISDLLGEALDAWNKYLKPVLDDLATKFDEVCKQYLQPLINEIIGLIGDVADVVKILWETWIKPLLSWLIQTFSPAIAIVWKALGTHLMTWFKLFSTEFKTIVKILRTVLQFIKDVFQVGWKQAWENMKSNFVKIWTDLKSDFIKIWNDLKSDFISIWYDIQDRIKDPLNSILSSIERLINSILDGFNWMVDKLNNFRIEIPDWVPEIGGRSFGINLDHFGSVQLPRLAQGAVIPPNKEFMAVLGDQKNGTNIETPLETMKQAFREAISETGGMGGVRQIQFILPNRQVIAEYVIEGGRIIQSSRGQNPFELA